MCIIYYMVATKPFFIVNELANCHRNQLISHLIYKDVKNVCHHFKDPDDLKCLFCSFCRPKPKDIQFISSKTKQKKKKKSIFDKMKEANCFPIKN